MACYGEVQERRENKYKYGVAKCHTVEFKYSDFVIVSLLLTQKWQCAKKVMSDSPGLVDFAIGLVNSVVNLPVE